MAVLSEGRGLRVRKYGPDASRGMSSRPTSWREAGGEIVAMLALCPPYGRAQPAPRRGGPSQARWRGGERFGDRRFSRRDALCASAWYGLPDARAFHPHPMRRRTARWPTGDMPRSSRCLPIRACGALPSATRPSRWETGLRSGPQDFAEGPFFGGTHSVRPRGKALRMPRHSLFTRR